MKNELYIKEILNHKKQYGNFATLNENIINEVNNYYKNSEIYDNTLTEKLYAYCYDINHCPDCGKITKFKNFSYGYTPRCKECGQIYSHKKSAEIKKKMFPREIIKCICKQCGKEFEYEKRIKNKQFQNKSFCNDSCKMKYYLHNISDEQREISMNKRRETCLKKYGNEYVVNSKYTRNKTKEKLGVEYPWQNKEIALKGSENFKIEHGCYPVQTPEIRHKISLTKIKKYGSNLPTGTFRYKEYIMPSGKIVKIQGYEDIALNTLLKTFNENDIFVERTPIENEIGEITYEINGFKHIYYPDIYIKSLNKIIEVKSKFTYDKHIETNIKKKESCLNKNINFEFWIINKQNGTIKII